MDKVKNKTIEQKRNALVLKKALKNMNKPMPKVVDGKMIINIDNQWQEEVFGDGKKM
ncbi:hypothetical protein YK48G_18150 [Lentilactobacillus fungorum]|uniref:Uncharacterized protein n=1 Tax=Lentilactobacillus fungorum TaxID=2201250 RepID=A0ABQ3VZQ0_9LACO|nr:hypothetical protein [Lentilactobacillus fungorum]GHP14390.1 hypothetical protein YK48G_18150 [Lentilactobacillus fungorum]